jgi:hypothetical protein
VQSVAMKWVDSTATEALLDVPPAEAPVSPHTKVVFLGAHWNVM